MPVLIMSLGVLLLTVAGCSRGPERRPTFIGQTEGVRRQIDVPVGLNPLGSLDGCPRAEALPHGRRVLISPPAQFTPEATRMIMALRESLAEEEEEVDFEMMLAAKPLRTEADAETEGKRCGAVIVLWEPTGTHTLEFTLPVPARIPLRRLVGERLCEFGNHREQLTILYLTIVGLAAMLDNRYDDAIYYLETAERIDHHCLRLPGGVRPAGQG